MTIMNPAARAMFGAAPLVQQSVSSPLLRQQRLLGPPAIGASGLTLPPAAAGGLGAILGHLGIELLEAILGPGAGGPSAVQEGGPIKELPVPFPDVIEGFFFGTLPRGAVPLIKDANGFPTCPRGYHPKKSEPNKGAYCVRNRRMDACNGRALNRALRRTSSFQRTVMRARKAARGMKKI